MDLPTNHRAGWALLLLGLLALGSLAGTPARAVPLAQPAGPPATPALLRPVAGSAATGGVPTVAAGPADAGAPDYLEPNDTWEQARALDLGVVYQALNFVPPNGGADADYYAWRAKPGECYVVSTGDLGPALDTTLLLWQAAPTREGRKLLAQNDDARPRTGDHSSAIHWCQASGAPDAWWLVIEVHNYGWAPATDPRGSGYSLLVAVEPATPTPTPTDTRTPVPTRTPRPAPESSSAGARGGAEATSRPGAASNAPAAAPVLLPTAIPPTATPVPSRTPLPPTPTPAPTGTPTATPTTTPSPTITATPIPVAQVDLVAYVAGPTQAGPQPGDGLVGLAVLLVDQHTNAVLQTTTTDANGYAHLAWGWQGPVFVVVPAFRWSRPVLTPPRDPAAGAAAGLFLDARLDAYILPGLWP